jgi:CelD/BcsL family acetyltransferase involved in cellulose biosynthesis
MTGTASDAAPRLTFAVEPAREVRDLAERWRALERLADPSFFVSWAWIGTWLSLLPQRIEPLCLSAYRGRELVALGLFSPRHERRHAVIKSRQLHLHCTGEAEWDCLAIEHNGLLARRGLERSTLRQACVYLMNGAPLCDEVFLDGVAQGALDVEGAPGFGVRLRADKPAPYFDLAALKKARVLDSLSANTRQQIARARRLYGEVSCELATSRHRALEVWRALADLNRAYRHGQGLESAFDSQFFQAFHDRLIGEQLEAGEVQLLRVIGENGTIGCLYNFLFRGRVYAYQSGLAYSPDNRLKPGLVSHGEAMELNRKAGARVYDFLAGEARYKTSLSTGVAHLSWVVVQRPRFDFKLEEAVRSLKRRTRA